MKNSKAILLLLTPSWVSNLVGAVLSIVLTAGTILLTTYQSSQLQQEIFEAHTNTLVNPTIASNYQTITTNLAGNRFLSDAPLFILWAFVGLIVYYFAIAIVSGLSHAEELREEMDYINARQQVLLKQALLHLTIRIVALAAWFAFIKLSLSVIVPYAVASAYIAANGFSLNDVGYALIALLVLFVNVYIHAIFLRLIALKPRLFGTA